MNGKHSDGNKRLGRRSQAAPGRRDIVLAKKRARVDLLDRLGEKSSGKGGLEALRLLAEVDLALSEGRRG